MLVLYLYLYLYLYENCCGFPPWVVGKMEDGRRKIQRKLNVRVRNRYLYLLQYGFRGKTHWSPLMPKTEKDQMSFNADAIFAKFFPWYKIPGKSYI
jgi:hypothetical protein